MNKMAKVKSLIAFVRGKATRRRHGKMLARWHAARHARRGL